MVTKKDVQTIVKICYDNALFDPELKGRDKEIEEFLLKVFIERKEEEKNKPVMTKEILDYLRKEADQEIREQLKKRGWYYKEVSDDIQEEVKLLINEINIRYNTRRKTDHKKIGNTLATCGLKWDSVGGKDCKKVKTIKHMIIEAD